MRRIVKMLFCLCLLAVILGLSSLPATAQTDETKASAPSTQTPTLASAPQTTSENKPQQTAAGDPVAPTAKTPNPQHQPKRILGIMPNYRAVSAGEIPPPPTPKQAFKIATQNSFDYSSFAFVGITSLLAEATDAHKQLGKGLDGFGNYYWRGFVDKTDGNYLVIFAYPTLFHQDERYFSKGKGGFVRRTAYAASRVLIAPSYSGHEDFNFSEVLGRASAQGISTAYYPKSDRTVGALAVRFGWAVGRDATTNVFREWWPDIATHVLHRHS